MAFTGIDSIVTSKATGKKMKVPFNNEVIKLTVSIGVSSYFGFGDAELKDLIHNADIALYKAKNNGRNRVELYDEKSEEF